MNAVSPTGLYLVDGSSGLGISDIARRNSVGVAGHDQGYRTLHWQDTDPEIIINDADLPLVRTGLNTLRRLMRVMPIPEDPRCYPPFYHHMTNCIQILPEIAEWFDDQNMDFKVISKLFNEVYFNSDDPTHPPQVATFHHSFLRLYTLNNLMLFKLVWL